MSMLKLSDKRIISVADSVLKYGLNETAEREGLAVKTIQRYIDEYRTRMLATDEEIQALHIKTSRTLQKYKDEKRIEGKLRREDNRIINAIQEYQQALIEQLKQYNLKAQTKKHKVPKTAAAGIVQISDTHFNELIDIEGNKYDFEIAGQRLALFAEHIKAIFGVYGVKNILLAFTGDLLNSDRRLDELLSQATNRAKASIISVDLLKQFILDLNTEYNISIVSVTGNESRIQKERGWSNVVASDNYDYTIPAILSRLFENATGIDFGSIDDNETVVSIAGKNILVTHGEAIKGKVAATAQQIIGRYALKGIQIDYIIHGHLHSAHLGDIQGRSASLAGGNAYSEFGLNLHGTASQNLYIIDRRGIHAHRICLQNTDGVKGYEVKAEDAYNTKSKSKMKQNTRIMEIVI